MSSLIVNTNLSALDAYNNLNATNQALSTAISRLSSGLQIQTAADNPAGYVISQGLLSQTNGYSQAVSNAQNGVSVLQTAEGALNQVTSILQTMDQLALANANSGATDTTAMQANQDQFSALQAQIDQIAQSTQFGTQQLLNGNYANQTFQIGAFVGGVNEITVSIPTVTAGALGVSSATVSIGTYTAASNAVSAVQAAISTVNSYEAQVGATQNELQSVIQNLTVGQQNMKSAYSSIVDVNMAKEMTAFTTDQILMQSGVAMLSQAQQAPSLVLKLLG